VSSVPPAQATERTAKVFVDNPSPFQTQLCGVHNDNDISAPTEQKLQRMTESTPLWQIRVTQDATPIGWRSHALDPVDIIYAWVLITESGFVLAETCLVNKPY